VEGYTLILDFLRGFFFLLFAGRISEAAMGSTGVGGHNMINMTIRELYYTSGDFYKTGTFLYIIYIILISQRVHVGSQCHLQLLY
jgi:hypothetical protein